MDERLVVVVVCTVSVQTSHDYNYLVQKSVFDGKQHGLMRRWHENGTLRTEVLYVDDKRNGLERSWHEDGTDSFLGITGGFGNENEPQVSTPSSSRQQLPARFHARIDPCFSSAEV